MLLAYLPALVTIISVPSWSNCCQSARISSWTFTPLTWGALSTLNDPPFAQQCRGSPQLCWGAEERRGAHRWTDFGTNHHHLNRCSLDWAGTVFSSPKKYIPSIFDHQQSEVPTSGRNLPFTSSPPLLWMYDRARGATAGAREHAGFIHFEPLTGDLGGCLIHNNTYSASDMR